MTAEITEMTSADYDEVFSLWRATENMGLSEADTKENIQSYLERNPGLSLVARQNGTVVGAVLCGHDGRRGYLHHLAVTRQKRENGLGKALVGECLARLAMIGIQKCHAFVYFENHDGQEFWRRIGWSGRTELVLMSKDT